MDDIRLAAVVLTKNEERDLPGCLASLQGVADEIFVIDSGSHDRTVEIAESMGARVFKHEFETHARQMNWGLATIQTRARWVMKIDADERVSDRLGSSLRALIDNAHDDLMGIQVPLRIQFLGKRLRFGGTYPIWLLRLWRLGRGRCEDRMMDEHIVVDPGRIVKAEGELLHVIPKSLSDWSRKHVWYAERECRDATLLDSTVSEVKGHAGLVRAAKTKVYYRLPPILRVVAYWFYRYVVLLGFLDGKVGFLYHFLQGLWYRMLVDGLLSEHREQCER